MGLFNSNAGHMPNFGTISTGAYGAEFMFKNVKDHF